MAQTGKIYSSHISNILNNLQGEVSFTVEDDTAPIFDTLFSQNAFNSIPEGSTISKIEIKFQSKINRTENRYKAQWSIYDVGYPLDWDGNYTGYTNLPKYQSTWTSSSKMNLLTNQYQPFTCTIDNPSLDAIRTGLMVRTRVTYEDTGFLGRSSTIYIKDFHVIAYYTPPTYIFDLNGSLDGGDPNSNISGWGTADVYINGALSSWEEKPSSGVNDFYGSFDYGTTYEVKNIVANSGYKYIGNSSYSGTLTSNTTIVLPFETTSTNMTYIGTKQPTFYLGTRQVQSIYLGMTLIYKVALLKVTATFSYLNNEDTYVDKITEVYYGASVEEFAKGITDYKLPENDKNCHYKNNGWVDFYGKSTLQSVTEDTTFVLSVSSEPHDIDPTIAGYDKKDPTCTEAGYIKGYCRYCAGQENGYKGLIQVDSPATGHKDTNGDNICDVCGERIAEIVDSGTCGDNLTYTLDSNGVLTISGTGDMQNSSFGWDKDLIKSVVINDGVTSIGDRALQYCTSLTNIIIGNNVTSIGKYAFDGCTNLTNITIPDSVTSINANAFEDCTGLTKITVSSGNTVYHSTDNCLIETENKTLISGCKNSIIPTDGSVTSIGNYAFDGCTGLTSITIPNSVTSIGTYAFYRCTGLTSINVSSGNTVYHSTNNCLIETETKTLILGCKSSIIPTDGSVTNIGKYAFRGCTGLTSITIPDSVTSIEPYAFYNCTGLTSVTIGNSVTSIGDRAFEECTGLTSITIPDSVTSIGVRAFDSCTNLTSITIPDSVTSIGDYVFSSCTGLTSITIGNSVTSIGDFVFYRCYGITSIIIPDSVTSIGNSAFSYCKNLTEVDFSTCTDIPTLESSNVFSNTSSNLAIKVPSDLVDQWKSATNWSTYADKIVSVKG